MSSDTSPGNFFSNLPIKAKLMGGFAVMILVTLISILLSLNSISKVGKSGIDAGTKYAPLVDAAMEIKLNATEVHLLLEEVLAGEQGRGFAVVADEVRTLAQKTQESTQQIKDIIDLLQKGTTEAVSAMDKSRNQATSCVEKAAEAGSSLDAMQVAVVTITQMNEQISSASVELGKAAAEIDSNMSNISVAAETNARNTQKLPETGDQLASLTTRMKDNIAKFTV